MSHRNIHESSKCHELKTHELVISHTQDTFVCRSLKTHESSKHTCVTNSRHMSWWYHTLKTHSCVGRSRRRSGLKYLDFEIYRFSRCIFWVTGTLFTHVKTCSKFWGLPRKRVWYVWGLLWKLVGNFGSGDDTKYDLLRLWILWWLITRLLYICIHTWISRISMYVYIHGSHEYLCMYTYI